MTEEEIRKKIYSKLQFKKDDKIERLSKDQMDFIIHEKDNSSFLKACPGSGKTEVVGIKAAFELIDWKKNYNGVAFLSFTNIAAKEIFERVVYFSGASASKHPHFIGTVDSWIYNYIFVPFFHYKVNYLGKGGDKSPKGIIDESSNADFLKGFSTYTPYVSQKTPNREMPIRANQYYFDAYENDIIYIPTRNKTIKISNYQNDNFLRSNLKGTKREFLLEEGKILDDFLNTKKKFWRSGYLTFRDLDFLSYRIIFKNPDIRELVVKRFPYLFVDECQDLSPTHIKILELLMDADCKIHLIGDLNQSIYEFRQVNPKIVSDFIEEQKFCEYSLKDNYRSNQSIVDTCSEVIKSSNPINGCEKLILEKSILVWEYEDKEFHDIPGKFVKHLEALNTSKIRIEKTAILVRGRTLVNRLSPFGYGISNCYESLANALSLWSKTQKNTTDIENALISCGRFLSTFAYESAGSKKNYYNQEGIENFRWRMFLTEFLDKAIKNLLPFIDSQGKGLNMSDWAKKVKDYIEDEWESLLVLPSIEYAKAKRKKIRNGTSKTLVSELIPSVKSSSGLRITTIHDVKGETLDAVLLISSKDMKSPGGHWQHWFKKSPRDEKEEEYKRFGYVAMSRPKHLLILAVPTLELRDRKMFTELGFKIEKINNNALF